MSSDDDHDLKLSFDEIIDHHDVFVGSEATDYGDHLLGSHFDDELWIHLFVCVSHKSKHVITVFFFFIYMGEYMVLRDFYFVSSMFYFCFFFISLEISQWVPMNN